MQADLASAFQRVREYRAARPFVPFKMVVDDGRQLPVEQPYFIAIPPGADFVVWSRPGGGFDRVSAESIREVVCDQ